MTYDIVLQMHAYTGIRLQNCCRQNDHDKTEGIQNL